MIQLEGIAARAGVLNGVDLAVAPGEHVVLMGGNGSGKTTLLLLIAALERADAGSVRVDGLDPFDATSTIEVRRRVGFVQQRPDDQIVATSVADDVAFGPENLGLPRAELQARVDEALQLTGLNGLEGREPHTLSGGQKQRLVIAGALAMRPAYLLLDEPTSQLDPAGRADVLAVLARAKADGCGILQVTHSMDEARRADRIVILHDGRIAFDGTPDALELRREQFAQWGIDTGLAPIQRVPYAGDDPARLSATDVSVTYRVGDIQVPALRRANLTVSAGDFVVVRGATGSGKSTLLNCLAGLLTPDAGTLTLDGQALTARSTRGRVGLIFQDPESQLFAETVLDDVAYGPRNLGADKQQAADAAQSALKRVGLDPERFGMLSPFRLSGGQARRVAIAGIISMQPQFILADEPTSALDPAGRDTVRALLAAMTEHAGVLVVTHNPEQFADVATATYRLVDGVLQ
ncbi:MAG: ATP-binding cassette domain-containing protein [Actinomycetes bacterium]|jgi:energy-coupling factor transport system ATP-binding protein|nr:ATP-binding cassette domain-containing protein [Actinomycetes bacterium]